MALQVKPATTRKGDVKGGERKWFADETHNKKGGKRTSREKTLSIEVGLPKLGGGKQTTPLAGSRGSPLTALTLYGGVC